MLFISLRSAELGDAFRVGCGDVLSAKSNPDVFPVILEQILSIETGTSLQIILVFKNKKSLLTKFRFRLWP